MRVKQGFKNYLLNNIHTNLRKSCFSIVEQLFLILKIPLNLIWFRQDWHGFNRGNVA